MEKLLAWIAYITDETIKAMGPIGHEVLYHLEYGFQENGLKNGVTRFSFHFTKQAI